MTIRVSTDDSLMSRKVFLSKFHTHCLCLFSSQSVFVPISWVEREDVVMGFDFIPGKIFITVFVEPDALYGKGIRGAVDTVNEVFIPKNHSAVFIQNGLVGKFIMFINQVSFASSIVCIFGSDMFNYCHKHPPQSLGFHISNLQGRELRF